MQLTNHNRFGTRILRPSVFFFAIIILWSSPGESGSVGQKQNGGLTFRKVFGYSPTGVSTFPGSRQQHQDVHRYKNYDVSNEVSLYIQADDIQLFVIEKTPTMRGDEERSRWYNVTFSLSQKAGQQFAAFANQNGGQAYEVSLAGNKLTIAPFMPEQNFQANSKFTFAVEASNANELRAMFAPFNGKIIWK